jgi:hypothetical protein
LDIGILKQIMLFIVIAMTLSGTLMPMTDLHAGNEWNDSCYDAGFSDGQNEPFNQSTYDHCGDEQGGADAYYEGFIHGCMSVEGNTRDTCESATDA